MRGHLLLATAKTAQASVQWQTLVWILGAAVAAALIIGVIVLVSRRPKSMEDGIEDFSRSLQAVAPAQRQASRVAQGQARPGATKAQAQAQAER